MTVELLWWDGCPSHPETLADLERILREEGIGHPPSRRTRSCIASNESRG